MFHVLFLRKLLEDILQQNEKVDREETRSGKRRSNTEERSGGSLSSS